MTTLQAITCGLSIPRVHHPTYARRRPSACRGELNSQTCGRRFNFPFSSCTCPGPIHTDFTRIHQNPRCTWDCCRFKSPQLHHSPSAKSLSLHVTNPVLREGNGVFLADLALCQRARFPRFRPFLALSSLFLPDVRSPKSGRSPLYESTTCGKSATGIFIEHWSGGLFVE